MSEKMRTHSTLKRLAYQLHLTEEFDFLSILQSRTKLATVMQNYS